MIFCLYLSGGGLLVQTLAFQLDSQVRIPGFGGFELPLSTNHRQLSFWIAQFEQHVIGSDFLTRQPQNSIDAALVSRRDPANILRNQGAETMDLTKHFPSLHRTGPYGAPFHTRSGRFEFRQSQCNEEN